MIFKYCNNCKYFSYLPNYYPFTNERTIPNYKYFDYLYKPKNKNCFCNMFYFYKCNCGSYHAAEMFIEEEIINKIPIYEAISDVENRFSELHEFLNKEENNSLKIEIKEYLQKHNGLNELAKYTLDKLWLLDIIVDNMNSSIIVIAETKEQAKELIRIKMELEPDVDIEKWFENNGIKFLLQKAKEVDDVWDEKFPNILAIT